MTQHPFLPICLLAAIVGGACGAHDEAASIDKAIADSVTRADAASAKSSAIEQRLAEAQEQVRKRPGNHAFSDKYRELGVRAGHQKDVLVFFESLLTQAPEPARANLNFQLGMAHLDYLAIADPTAKSGLVDRALVCFDKALQLDPRLWEAAYAKALVYLQLPKSYGQAQRGVNLLRELLDKQSRWKQEPEFAMTYIALASALEQHGETTAADRVWNEGVRKFPANAALQRRERIDVSQ